MQDAFIRITRTGRVYVSPAAREIMNFSKDEYTSVKVDNVIDGEPTDFAAFGVNTNILPTRFDLEGRSTTRFYISPHAKPPIYLVYKETLNEVHYFKPAGAV
ncbi:PAS domain-containing protein [Paenibacillus kribbensis]|uniref:PAS domain-containing protein n=1 Tax=Paenibacillus kribbensis TaxID=172713 RepID=UPI002DB7BE1A|nr:PAS domain-containing protein [Paenibacillus kribbensis]MEC0237812.1 PAS domain-containing protein [Paenibacillus kribbensis]